MVSRIFIGRPIFAWVIAIVVMLLGLGAIRLLPDCTIPGRRAAAGFRAC